MTELFLEKIEKAFAQKRWRVSAAVRNVATILENSQKPFSAQQIGIQLAQKFQAMDATTVYRILHRMQEAGLVHRVQEKFIRCTEPNNALEHHFLVCAECGEGEEIFLDYRESISSQLAKEKSFLLREVELSFRGVCKDCTKK